jgi:hypothetical protein
MLLLLCALCIGTNPSLRVPPREGRRVPPRDGCRCLSDFAIIHLRLFIFDYYIL